MLGYLAPVLQQAQGILKPWVYQCPLTEYITWANNIMISMGAVPARTSQTMQLTMPWAVQVYTCTHKQYVLQHSVVHGPRPNLGGFCNVSSLHLTSSGSIRGPLHGVSNASPADRTNSFGGTRLSTAGYWRLYRIKVQGSLVLVLCEAHDRQRVLHNEAHDLPCHL